MEKLKEMVVYLANESRDDQAFGVVKLNKLLFFCDFFNYGMYGTPISEAKYVHLPYGPAPDGMKQILDELEKSGRIRIEEQERAIGMKLQRIYPIGDADIKKFSKQEKGLIDYMREENCGTTGTYLSWVSHLCLPWLATSIGKEIPYSMAFCLIKNAATQDDRVWARKELKRLRLEEGYGY